MPAVRVMDSVMTMIFGAMMIIMTAFGLETATPSLYGGFGGLLGVTLQVLVMGLVGLSVQSVNISNGDLEKVRRRIKRLGAANVYRQTASHDQSCPICSESTKGREVANFLSDGNTSVFGNRVSKWLHFECGINSGFAVGAKRTAKSRKTPSAESGKTIHFQHLYFGTPLDFKRIFKVAVHDPTFGDSFYTNEAENDIVNWIRNSPHSSLYSMAQSEPKTKEPVVEPVISKPVATKVAKGGSALEKAILEIAGQALDEETVRRIARETADSQIAQFSTTFAPIRTLRVMKGQSIVANNNEVYHPHFPTTLGIMTAGLVTRGFPNPVLLTGAAGTGKSYAAKMLHRLLQEVGLLSDEMEYKEVVCFADMERGDLLGRVSYNITNGENRWNQSGLTTVLLNGGIAFVDELDKADPAVATLLNGVLASRQVVNPINGAVLPVSNNAFIIAAANTTGFTKSPQYVAAARQDASLLDRFAGGFVSFGHSDRIMAHICGLSNAGKMEAEESPAGNPATQQEVFDAFKALKDLSDSSRSPVPMSYRALEVGISLANAGWTMPSIVARWIVPFNPELQRNVVANSIGGLTSHEESASLIPQNVEPIVVSGGAV